jgi:hypothetical protein
MERIASMAAILEVTWINREITYKKYKSSSTDLLKAKYILNNAKDRDNIYN